MQILNIAGYQFHPLDNLEQLRSQFLDICTTLQIKGTILLSQEGINISLAGPIDQIRRFQAYLSNTALFAHIKFHETFSTSTPFHHLKVKIKNEIITFGQENMDVAMNKAPNISPQEFKQWLDESRDITILDTRNDYEVRFGTFKNAVNLNIKDFGEFPNTLDQIDRTKPVVMFCTGGIRCEKAAIYLLNHGYENVYQLEGGILGYFAQVGGDHYDGECFIFDERIAVNAKLEATGTKQCLVCQGPYKGDACHCG